MGWACSQTWPSRPNSGAKRQAPTSARQLQSANAMRHWWPALRVPGVERSSGLDKLQQCMSCSVG